MHLNLDKRTKWNTSFKLVTLLTIWSLAHCPLVLSSGGGSAGDENGAIRENDGEIEVDDIQKDSGNDDIAGSFVEEESKERIRLYQYDPVEVGYIRYVEVSPGRYIQMKTIAVKPPAFEIPKFLTPEECERLKELALDAGLSSSRILDYNLNFTGIDSTKVVYNATEWIPKLTKCDNNTDRSLDFTEVLHCLPGLEEGETVPPDMLQTMYLQVKLDLDSNGLINAKELWLMNLENKTIEIKEWLSQWRQGNVSKVKGRGRVRISEQAWIDWSNSKEPMVVRYQPGGHYNAHLDSQSVQEDHQCIHTFNSKIEKESRLCRFMTILYYLQDQEGGGETAFPLAEFENISKEYKKNLGYNYLDLSRNCYKNLHVKPEYGKAIMWYNHHIDEETGWMSSLNKHGVHGGCDVKKGTKWIANNWITVDDVYERQMEFHARIFKPRKDDGTEEKSGNETNDEENHTVEGNEEGGIESNDDASDQINDNEISSGERSTPSSDESAGGDLSREHVEL